MCVCVCVFNVLSCTSVKRHKIRSERVRMSVRVCVFIRPEAKRRIYTHRIGFTMILRHPLRRSLYFFSPFSQTIYLFVSVLLAYTHHTVQRYIYIYILYVTYVYIGMYINNTLYNTVAWGRVPRPPENTDEIPYFFFFF